MKLRILSVFAVAAILAGCATAPEIAATAEGSGGDAGGVQAVNQPVTTEVAPVEEAAVTVGPAEDTAEYFQLNVGDRVFFDFDKYNLKAEAQQTLELQAAWLRKFPQRTLIIEGHADERGTREYNLALGERRANSARDYLVSLGIDPARVQIISYGEERPVALGQNEEAWALNRRAVTVIQN